MQTMTSAPTGTIASSSNPPRDGGVTFRVAVLCLGLAALFGYVIPVVDFKLFNTFLGATHLLPGAIAALLLLLLIVNPILQLVSQKLVFTRNETLTVYISCLIPGHGGESFIIPNPGWARTDTSIAASSNRASPA